MINPYSSYILSFLLSLGAFWLGWSGLFPPVSQYLILFLLVTFLFHFGFSFYWKKKLAPALKATDIYFNPIAITIFLYALWSLDFVYEGGVPLLKILLNQPYDYRLFGFPSVHVFTVTFSSFFTVYLFALYVSTRKRLYLVLYLVNLFAALLIFSRAMLIFNIISSLFVYFLSSPSISFRLGVLLLAGLISLVFGFGLLGSLRVSFEAKRKYDTELFLDIGEATPSFRKSVIPKDFFWGYIYLASPLANLQYNINTFHVPPFSLGRLMQHINNEMLFDFISKRTNRLFGLKREAENIIPKKPFNVSTVYSRSFSYQGLTGMIVMAIFVLMVPWLYIQFLPANRYSLTGIAILNTMYLFLFYDNTIRFTGLGLQLVYPFILPMAEKANAWLLKK